MFHHLRQIGAGECFFAYRMVIVQLRRELPMAQVDFPVTANTPAAGFDSPPGIASKQAGHFAINWSILW